MHLIFMIFILPFLVLHFLPTLIAGLRHAHNFGWILVLNFFLGWTIIGWIVALIWALNDEPRYVIGYMPPPPPYTPPPPYNR